jgi:hypothetical protein
MIRRTISVHAPEDVLLRPNVSNGSYRGLHIMHRDHKGHTPTQLHKH